jgi:PAS domain S-box-containing protein
MTTAAGWRLLDPLVRRLGGPRVVALPLLRLLAVILGVLWVVLQPESGAPTAAVTVAIFLAYSVALVVALWLDPVATLRLNVLVLSVDLAFALLLIVETGGHLSGRFPALLLIAGLQAYYYGLRRGMLVAVIATGAYLIIVWPALQGVEWANVAVRLCALLGTALGVGLLGGLEDQERAKVDALTQRAQERERFISNVVASLQEGVVALDVEGRVVAWNEAMERRYAVSAAEVVGRSFFDSFPSVDREAWGAALRQLLTGAVEEFTFEGIEHQTLRRGRVIQNLKAGLLRQNGQPAGAVLLIEDITERVALERSARQAEKLASLGTLAAGIAHEMNNPIGVISSRIELMLLDAESRPLAEDVRDDLNVLHRHAQRVSKIAQGLLSFARHAPREQGPVDLNRVVEETLLLVDKSMMRDGLVLRRHLAANLPPVWGDSNALQQVVLNLVTNARDALDGRGEIVVETAVEGDAVRLLVRDTGRGIPPETLPRVFDPFFTTKPNGTGLGLSISYGIVRDHHGTVDVQSSPGRGTTFILAFPVAREAAPA